MSKDTPGPGPRPVPVPAPASSRVIGERARIVLLVVSDDGTRDRLADALWRAGLSVIAASSAELAMRRMDEGVVPLVIIIDGTMPDQGWPVWDARQARHPEVPVVLLTDAFSSGRGDAVVVSKLPLDVDAVCAKAASLCERR